VVGGRSGAGEVAILGHLWPDPKGNKSLSPRLPKLLRLHKALLGAQAGHGCHTPEDGLLHFSFSPDPHIPGTPRCTSPSEGEKADGWRNRATLMPLRNLKTLAPA
jgi:hypothetical protein